MTQADIVIIGGGMVGATLACALAERHWRVALVEARPPQPFDPDSPWDLRVSAISRASQRIFEHLQLWPAMQAMRVSPYDRMVVWEEGAGEIRFDAADMAEPDLGHIIENRVIQRAAWQRLEQLDDVLLHCPARIATLETADEAVRVGLEGGETIEARLVVGADGARSRLRELAGIGVSRQDYGQKGIVCLVEVERGHEYTAWQRFLPSGPLALLPLADTRQCSIVWSADTPLADELMALDDAAFAERLQAAFGTRLGALRPLGRRAAFPLAGSQAQHYVQHRLALVGDAAHTIHPLAGQGVNLGLLDAADLVDRLRPGHDPGGRAALRAYERTRRSEDVLMMRAMEGFRYLFGNELAPLRLLRGAGLSLADRLPPLKQAFMRQALGLRRDLPALARVGCA
ncbi:MAG: FAD-dependent oxidoreductase [Gammaproteobacteria bacterium]|nr:MAG: FAD-dependent oxidoreductase [Gammaproteobacteria bacterium]